MRVYDYNTGESVHGTPTEELIEASRAAEPTGAVNAYVDDADVWHFVEASQRDFTERHLKLDVLTVYVTE